LAVSAVAADVLACETGMQTDTLAKFLHTDTPATRLRVGDVVVTGSLELPETDEPPKLTS
jgi:hypothetical protein